MNRLEDTMNASKIYSLLVSSAPYQPATNYWRAVELDAVLQHSLPGGRGLDLGCGDGKLTHVLTQALPTEINRSWVGVDPDPAETKLAVGIGVYEAVHTCGGDSIPEKNSSFDYVFSNSVLEHIPEIEPVIAEIARIIRPKGRFIFTVPSDTFHSCLGGPLFGATSEHYFKRIDTRCAHERYWGLEQWAACLDRHGFDILGNVNYLDTHQTRRWETLSNLTGGLLYKLHGDRMRPIDIQRRLRMRRAKGGGIDWLAAQVSRMALLGANPQSDGTSAPHAYLLIDAIRR